MADSELDPGANTQMFRAFVEREEPAQDARSFGGSLLVTGLLVAIAAVVVIGYLLIHG